VAILSVLGYEPTECYTGRAPLEAAAMGLDVGDAWVFRCNLVTIIDGLMVDNTAGHISNPEAHELIGRLNEALADETIRFHPGVSYRHLMTYAGKCNVTTTPPHDILEQPAGKYLPVGHGAAELRMLMEKAHPILAGSEINDIRRDLGDNVATDIWLWGQGTMPHLRRFKARFGVQGAVIAAVDLIRGIAKLIDWDRIEVEGATGYIDTNYAGKGAAAVEALATHDLVCVHVEAPDEAGHNANVAAKIAAIEQIDRHIVGPVLERLKAEGEDWRILVLPDHPTPCRVRTHTADPVPFAMAGKRVPAVVERAFNEEEAARADLHVERGCDLMEFFLTVR
jgi:2,3-bisphosphoglycerate-independent phosphoglycerate mutase